MKGEKERTSLIYSNKMDHDKRRDRLSDHTDDHPMDNTIDKQRSVVFDILHREECFSIDWQSVHWEKPEEREKIIFLYMIPNDHLLVVLQSSKWSNWLDRHHLRLCFLSVDQ